MRKSLKIFLVLLLVLIFSLATALGFVILTFDDGDYRRGLVTLVNSLTDYQIKIEEPFSFHFSQRPVLTAGVVKVVLPGHSEELVLRKVDLVLVPSTLLQGRLQVGVSGLVDDQVSLDWLLPRELHVLKSVELAGQVTATGSELGIREFKVRGSNPQGVKIEIAGAGLINDFSAPQPFSELDLLIKVVSPESRGFVGYLPEDLPELGPVRGSLRLLAVSPEALGVEEIALDFGSDDSLSLRAEGRIAEIPVAPGTINSGIDIKLKVISPRTQDLNDLFAISLPEVGVITSSVSLRGSDQELQLNDLKLRFGRNAIEAELRASSVAKRLKVAGRITSEALYLDDFFLRLPASQTGTSQILQKSAKAAEKPADESLDDVPLFSSKSFSLDFMRDLNCDFDIAVDQVIGFRDVLKDFKVGVRINDDTLSIDPVNFVFEGGYVKASLVMADVAAVPEVELKCTIDDLDLVDTLGSFGLNSAVTGELTVNVDLSSRGLSPHDLAANLNGYLNMALEEGRVPSHALNLIAVDMLGWSFRRALMKKNYAEINCGVLSLQAENGVLECRTFILESPGLRITGAGNVDLVAETCDLTLYPKKKKKFWATVTPVTIKGDLRNPTVRAIPVKTLAVLYGGALLAPQFFLPAIGMNYLWEMVTKDKGGVQSPCFEYLQQ